MGHCTLSLGEIPHHGNMHSGLINVEHRIGVKIPQQFPLEVFKIKSFD
jgi:hypothetical protein